MARWLAIDYGQKRCGIAVTDPLNIIAAPLDTIPTHQIWQFLQSYINTESVELVVVGMPSNLDATPGKTTQLVKKFIAQLQAKFPSLAVHQVDERFTSAIAAKTMLASGARKTERQKKENLDKISAALILQSFMEQRALIK